MERCQGLRFNEHGADSVKEYLESTTNQPLAHHIRVESVPEECLSQHVLQEDCFEASRQVSINAIYPQILMMF